MESKLKTEKGFVNININMESKQMYISNHPYTTKEEAEKAILISANVVKVGCFEIEYPVSY